MKINGHIKHVVQASMRLLKDSVLVRHLMLSCVVAILMILIYPPLQWDSFLTDLFFDTEQQRFPLKHAPFLDQWMHTGLKWLMVAVALGSLCLSFIAFGVDRIKPYQKSFACVFIGMTISTTMVALLKHYNLHGCPWDLQMYGGTLPFFDLFSAPPLGIEAGRCFPAGHPSGGFALLAFYYAFGHHLPLFAKRMCYLALFAGSIMGLTQIIRGAHFLSHVLWSAWVVWVCLLMLYWLWPPQVRQT